METKRPNHKIAPKGTMKVLDPAQLPYIKGGNGSSPMPPKSQQVRKK